MKKSDEKSKENKMKKKDLLPSDSSMNIKGSPAMMSMIAKGIKKAPPPLE